MKEFKGPQYYLNNPRLKAENVKVNFTQEQIDELIRCKTDIKYFANNYVKIINLDKGLMNINLYPYQERLVQSYYDNRFTIVLSPRQTGKSTSGLIYLLHAVIFNDYHECAILANKHAIALELLGRIKLMYENLPFWMQIGIVEWNKSSIELENGSKITASATSASAVRGRSISSVLLDEFSFISNDLAQEFISSVFPTISSGKNSKIIISSTPNGLNHFYQMWTDAEQGNSLFCPIKVNYWDVPGRDDAWKEKMLKTMSLDKFEQEYNNAFLGSCDTLISATKLRNLVNGKPEYQKDGLRVYEYPKTDEESKKSNVYMLTVDCSEGKGQDYNAFSVIDITEFPMRQVATFYDNTMSYLQFPDVIYEVARKFNNAYVLLETNSVGQEVGHILLHECEYENIIFTEKGVMGIRTNKNVKKIGCINLKELIEQDKLILTDENTITELNNFIRYGYTYCADDGHHDDLVMGLVLFAWFSSKDDFKDMTDLSFRNTINTNFDDFMPVTYIDNGVEDKDTNRLYNDTSLII